LNLPVVNKPVTAKVRKVQIELLYDAATINHLSEIMKKHGKSKKIFKLLLQVNLARMCYILRLDSGYSL